MTNIRPLRIFVSSPGDVAEERALTERVLRRLGAEYDESVRLDVVMWEHEPLFAHAGFQDQLPPPSECDLVISILWSRMGTRLPERIAGATGSINMTGTEFEIADALDGHRRIGKPNLLIYKKTTPPHVNLATADAHERLRQVHAGLL